MKLKLLIAIVLLSVACWAQDKPKAAAPASPFAASTVSFNLTPVSLPGQQQTLSGVETDALINFTEYLNLGYTTLISTSPFMGGRYEVAIPVISNYLEKHTALTGANWQVGVTGSVGVVKSSVKSYWGERAGIFAKYAPAGNANFNLGLDVEWNNLPGVDPSNPSYGHHVVSLAVGPNFRF